MELFHEELDTPIDSKFNFSKSEVSAICFCEECKRFTLSKRWQTEPKKRARMNERMHTHAQAQLIRPKQNATPPLHNGKNIIGLLIREPV